MPTLYFDHIDLDRIASSGQCFRWISLSAGKYAIPLRGALYEAEQIAPNAVYVEADLPEALVREAMSDYFDAGSDYDAILRAIDPADAYLRSAAESEGGIRILRQPLWETVASFLISQNNNIPRIRTILARLCGGARAPFPSAEEVARLSPQELRAMGLGYRADYLTRTAERFAQGEEEAALGAMDYAAARERLMTCAGIGPKVADCVCLYGLGMKEAFPTDVWVRRILELRYPKGFGQRSSPYAGVYQQYMFAYERKLEGVGR